VNLLNVTPAEAARALEELVATRGDAPYRARQAHRWLWTRPAAGWEHATDLPAGLQDHLQSRAPLARLTLATRQTSRDGTVKSLWQLPDGLTVESVWIPEGRRTTLCISSQAGCAFRCRFCATGRMGLARHLDPWEIAAQIREMVLDPEFGVPSNVVFMGMGEPLHNWRGVDTALTILNQADGLGIGARRITVSTIGLIPRLEQLARRPEQFRLAVSLHAGSGARRAALMPIERKYPLDRLIPVLRRFRKRITLEYVLIRHHNDADQDARDLAGIARDLGALVNLLPLHPGGAGDLRPSPTGRIARFAALLRDRGVRVTVRRSRGLDIAAACGQLRTETLNDRPRRVPESP